MDPDSKTQFTRSTPIFKVGDWLADPNTCRLYTSDQSVKLEVKVMELLILLASQPGRVVSRVDMEKIVWAGTVVGYDAVSNAIRKLRKALDDTSTDPRYIETVSKKGYRLVAPVQMPYEENAPTESEGQQAPKSGTGLRFPEKKLWIGLGLLLFGAFLWWVLPLADRMPGEPFTDNVSIAVLPLENLGDDSKQQYFVDGLTNDLTTDLTKFPGLLVISRDSSFFYKDHKRDALVAAHELGVDYVLHGSIRRSGDRLRVNIILSKTRSDEHIWADRFEGNLANLFGLQDQINREIVSALALRVTPAEQQHLVQRGTENLKAYDLYLRGTDQFFRYARNSNLEARKYFTSATELDPGFGRAYAMLGWTHVFDFMNGWSKQPEQSLTLGEQYASRALTIDARLPVAYFVRGLAYRERGEYIKAMVESEKAVALDPNYANGHVLHATLLYYAGNPEEGLKEMLKAARLNPHHPHNYPFHIGQAYFVLARYPEAIKAFSEGLASNPLSERLRVWLAAAYAMNGDLDEAQWQMEQIALSNPEFSIDKQAKAFPFKNEADLQRFVSALKRAAPNQH